jgi:hypothetical protein
MDMSISHLVSQTPSAKIVSVNFSRPALAQPAGTRVAELPARARVEPATKP